MEEKVKLSMLCQIYGKMLTKKQYEIINDYCNNDLSLSEIAENNSITRQAVRDIIMKGEKKLCKIENTSSDKKIAKILNHISKELSCLV